MTAHQAEIAHLLQREGVILSRQHPALRAALARETRRGRLDRFLPGVYLGHGAAEQPAARIRAAAVWVSDGVLTGAAAARLTFWPHVLMPTITVAAGHVRGRQPGVEVRHRTIPPELIIERAGLRCTTPAATALDLVAETGSADAIDQVLRSRMASIGDLWAALDQLPGRPGNQLCRVLLHDSRDSPWSAAERQLHRLLRAAGITGWVSNLAVTTELGRHYLDVGFAEHLLAIEVDGYEHHSDRAAFEHDRVRQNALTMAGWTVLRFTWRMLTDEPAQVISTIERALAAR